MKTLTLSFPAAGFARRDRYVYGPKQKTISQPSLQTMATDTVHFGASAGESDRAFLENFFRDNATDTTKIPNILAPATREEKAQSIAFNRYMDALKQGKKPFLPVSYHKTLVEEGYLKADNKAWDIERSAFRKYITEVLYKNDSDEVRDQGLRTAGFKPKSKHKKSVKPNPEEAPTEIKAPLEAPEASQLTEQPKKKAIAFDFDWAEEAASAPAFVEQALKESRQKNRFGEGLRELMARNANSRRH